jgi:hypothetical protein
MTCVAMTDAIASLAAKATTLSRVAKAKTNSMAVQATIAFGAKMKSNPKKVLFFSEAIARWRIAVIAPRPTQTSTIKV